MSHLTKQQLATLTSQLEQDRDVLNKQLTQNEHFQKGQSLRDTTSELSTIDNHPADVASEMYEREKDTALREHEELQLMRIEQALDNIQSGTYGTCITCGEDIPYDRLHAVPETEYCMKHSPQSQISTDRPIEEQLLSPPFGRTSLDEYERPGFDGEDAWQIVESYGTSDSPALAEDSDIHNYNDLVIENDEEFDGFVEPLESFVATDIYGQNICFYRNSEYHKLIDSELSDAEQSLGTGSNTY